MSKAKTDKKNWIYKYYQQIQDGSVNVGEWVKLSYDYVIKGLENKEFFYDSKKANLAINFIESYCRHAKGVLAPNLLKLELWQKAYVACLFGIVDKDGNRQFRESLLIVGRKNGKTLLMSAIAAYVAFLENDYGKEVFFVAPKLRQANICYDCFYQTVRLDKELDSLARKRRTDIYIEQNNTTVEPLAFSENKSAGLNISLCIADEIADWKGVSGVKFYEVLKSSCGARKQPLIIACSSAGYENDGIYDELFRRATSVLKGSGAVKETRFLPMIYAIDDIEKWNDINELEKANPNLNVSVSVNYMIDEIAVAENSLSKKREFIVRYCNIKQNSSAAWLNIDVIQNAIVKDITLDDLKDSYAVCGIDLSQTTDLTACVTLIEKEGIIYAHSKFWLPSEKIEEAMERDNIDYNLYIQQGYLETSGENFVDYNDCYNWLVSLVEEKTILPLKVGYDRYSAQYLIKDLDNYGFNTDDVYQGDNLYPVIQETDGLLRDKKLKIIYNPLMVMHLADSAIKYNTERGRGRLIKAGSKVHIDGTAALLDGLCVRQKWYEEIGDRLKNN